jgi:hypothetical protein
MPPPSLDILRHLQDPAADVDVAEQAFKEHVLTLKVWIPGIQTDAGDTQTSNLCLRTGKNGAPPILEMFTVEADAIAEQGTQYFASTFFAGIIYAQRARMDLSVREGDEVVFLTHDQILALRDMISLGSDGDSMGQQEMAEYLMVSRNFGARARSYCAQHDDIESLHMGILMLPGVKPMLLGTLNAARKDAHAEALSQIGRELFWPAWRFSLNEDGSGSGLDTVSKLKQLPPCFTKANDTGWWNKLKNMFSGPTIGIIQGTIE